jgi:4-carboxymuconolactone decarboxylase
MAEPDITRPGEPAARRPRFYRTLVEQQPDLISALDQLGAAARRAGPLDERTVQMVQLAAAATMRSEGAVHSHVRRALSEGVAPDELRHVVLALVSTIGFPNMVAALTWVEDELESGGGAHARA